MKVEVNPVNRGHLFPVRRVELCAAAQDAFGRFMVVPVLSVAELHAGKLVAALDRQHPRDLFDARHILHRLDTEAGATDLADLQLAMLAMLLSSGRPPQELLAPRAQNRAAAYAGQFAGMTREQFGLADHVATFDRLVAALPRLLPEHHRVAMLTAFAKNAAQPALPERVAILPAVAWKFRNLQRLRDENAGAHAEQVNRLRACLHQMG